LNDLIVGSEEEYDNMVQATSTPNPPRKEREFAD